MKKMTQNERRLFLLHRLMEEYSPHYRIAMPDNASEQKQLLRALMNIRVPKPMDDVFLCIQNAYLQEEICQKGITEVRDLIPIRDKIYLWQGDITTLKADAIVNAANSQMLGCFHPCHSCIDNAIHTFSGIQLRLVCAELMQKQGFPEPVGRAKLTPAFNLPCRYILHTVGPIIHGQPTVKDRRLLASCYRSCLQLADQHGLQSIAFCCIATGEFHFPREEAAKIAIQTTNFYREQTHSRIEVIFNVFTRQDFEIYRTLLATDRTL